MCKLINCKKCGLYTWTGCGAHKDEVMKEIPQDKRCKCKKLVANAKIKHVQ